MSKLFADLMEKHSPPSSVGSIPSTAAAEKSSPGSEAKKEPAAGSPRSEDKPSDAMNTAVTPRYHDTTRPRSHDTTAPRYGEPIKPPSDDNREPRNQDRLIETIRKAVRQIGKESATHRFTQEEKRALAGVIYTYKARGIRTSENEIARVGLNFLLEDYHAHGETSILARVLKQLNE